MCSRLPTLIVTLNGFIIEKTFLGLLRVLEFPSFSIYILKTSKSVGSHINITSYE